MARAPASCVLLRMGHDSAARSPTMTMGNVMSIGPHRSGAELAPADSSLARAAVDEHARVGLTLLRSAAYSRPSSCSGRRQPMIDSRRRFLKIGAVATAYGALGPMAGAAADDPALGLIFPP